jgi:hypothetical protein
MGRIVTEIRLNRDYYHLHPKIGAWCEEHFGPVDFYNLSNGRWHRDMMFGYQDYTFQHDEDATFFALYWIKK